MKSGQFSAYINLNTQTITLVKTPGEFEFQSNSNFTPLIEYTAKKDVLNKCTEFFEENYIPEERRIILN